MKRMLFNATQAEELRVAIVDGQTLLDLDIETLGKEQRKGNIYKGVITRIEPSLEACFVDYGTDRHGFLPFKEISRSYFQDHDGNKARIQDVLKEGMHVIVQVEKDERGNKGAALTTFISLAGRYLVLMPNNPRGGGVSRRIEGDERQELKETMAQLNVPRGMSLIARTAGIGRSVEELEWDFHYLLQLWKAIETAAAAHSEPYLLFMESALVIRAIRDYFRSDIGEILIDNPEVYQEVSEFMSYVMPNNTGRLKLYEDHTPLFSRFQIEHQIESAFSRSVSLPSGGAIVIDHTEALVSIDVNSARATRGADIEETAFKTNMEAAEEVARQMRLRDLGGLVVIDFIDMENPKHQRDVENTLRDALKKDRARVQMGKLSRFGLLELSRQRLKPALGESSHVACPRCAGTGVIRSIESTALHVLRIIQEEAMKENTGEVHAQVPVDVATFLLNEKRAELFGLEERLDVSVFLIPNTHLDNPHYQITRVRTDDVDENAEPSYKRVEVPEPDENTKPFGGEKAKAVRPEAAVKGVKHTQPAPVVTRKSEGIFHSIVNWFKGLFASETEKTDSKTERKAKPNNRRNVSKRRHNNRRHQASRQDNNDTNNHADGKAEQAPKTSRQKRQEQRHERRQQPVEAVQNNNIEQANHSTPVVVAEPPAKVEARQEKRERHHSVEKNNTVAVTNDVANNRETTRAERVQPEATTSNTQGENNKPHRQRRENHRNQRDRNRRNDKKRNIPSAAKIEQYLMISEAAEKVRLAVAHVFAESNDSNRTALESKEPLIITIPLLEDDEQTQIVFINNEPSAETKVQHDVTNEHQDEQQMVQDCCLRTQLAVQHVLSQSLDLVATQAAITTATPVELFAIDSAADTPSCANDVTPSDTPNQSVSQTNELILVETSKEALAQAALRTEVAPVVGLRRSDLPRQEHTYEEQVMVQVETRPQA